MLQRIKHPRIYHLPWSDGLTNDDKRIESLDNFKDQQIIVTTKLDGENTTIYSDGYVHARSLESDSHYTRDWIKNFISKMYFNIPENYRICGKNVTYKHSIYYDNLKSYFYVHSIWNDKNECLSWDDIIEYCKLLNLEIVPLLYKGIFNEQLIKNLYKNEMEGYVIRLAEKIEFDMFEKSIAKFVSSEFKKNFGDNHWKYTKLIKNKLN